MKNCTKCVSYNKIKNACDRTGLEIISVLCCKNYLKGLNKAQKLKRTTINKKVLLKRTRNKSAKKRLNKGFSTLYPIMSHIITYKIIKDYQKLTR